MEPLKIIDYINMPLPALTQHPDYEIEIMTAVVQMSLMPARELVSLMTTGNN